MEKGAKLHHISSDGKTPAMKLFENSCFECFDYFEKKNGLSWGAKLADKNGESALHLLLIQARQTSKDPRTIAKLKTIARLMVQKGADLDQKNSFGESPDSLATKWGLRKILTFKNGLLGD